MGTRSHDDEQQVEFEAMRKRLLVKDRRAARKLLKDFEAQIAKTAPQVTPAFRKMFSAAKLNDLKKALVASKLKHQKAEIQNVVRDFRHYGLVLMSLSDQELGQFVWRFYQTVFRMVTKTVGVKSGVKSSRATKSSRSRKSAA